MRISRSPKATFEFLADIANRPRWVVANVLSTTATTDLHWWDMVTPHGKARLRMRADERYGILDHDFVDSSASWTVPARVIANAGGTEFTITFFQPPSLTDEVFDEQVKPVDIELGKLKELLESQTDRAT